MKKILPYLTLLLSTAAIVLASLAYARSSSRAEAIVQEREQAFIRRMKPTLLNIYAGMDLEKIDTEPKTIEDLLEPWFNAMEAMGKSEPANPPVHRPADTARPLPTRDAASVR